MQKHSSIRTASCALALKALKALKARSVNPTRVSTRLLSLTTAGAYLLRLKSRRKLHDALRPSIVIAFVILSQSLLLI